MSHILQDYRGPVVVGDGTFSGKPVGESHYQDHLETLCGGRTEDGHCMEVVAYLRPEPDNPHDPNAVMVFIDGGKVGYLSRDDAKAYQEALAKAGLGGQSVAVAAQIVGGWETEQGDLGHFGVRLALTFPPEFSG